MAVRSTRLAAGSGDVSSGYTTIYTVPADRIALVKEITLTNLSAGASTMQLACRVGGAGTTYPIEIQTGIAATAALKASGRFHVLHAGDQLKVSGSSSTTWYVSGALLLAPA